MYGIDVLDHTTGRVVHNDYVGQTRQKGRARENQHRDSQPFADRIVGSPNVLWEGLCTDDELDAIERRFIRELRPRLNWVHNEDNPEQIPKWVQEEQRHARDDAAGRPRWAPLEQRSAASLLDQPMRTFPTAAPVPVRRPWPAWKQKTALWTGSWLLITATIMSGARTYGTVIAWPPLLTVATTLQAVVVVWSLLGAPLTKQERRRAKRRLPRWLR